MLSQSEGLHMPSPFTNSNSATPEDAREDTPPLDSGSLHQGRLQQCMTSYSTAGLTLPIPPLYNDSMARFAMPAQYDQNAALAFASVVNDPADSNPSVFVYNVQGVNGSAEITTTYESNNTGYAGYQWSSYSN
jgi:hypothetical protein